MKSIGQDWKAAGYARQMLWRGTLYQSRLAKNFHGQANMIHNGMTANKPPVSSGKKGGQMIVEESFGNFINVYVDGYVLRLTVKNVSGISEMATTLLNA